MSGKVKCDRCYCAASRIRKKVPPAERCCIAGGKCPNPIAWIFVIEHPEAGIDVVSTCDEHKPFMYLAFTGDIDYPHTDDCDGGDGFAGWDDDCTDYGGPDE